ncbi:sugar ABC transporter substrate-binding protein [Micrococcales bacterium 31B]|nr:sugar ABC transporter substrate-binding protein [Micrococcales bacterium 31B]
MHTPRIIADAPALPASPALPPSPAPRASAPQTQGLRRFTAGLAALALCLPLAACGAGAASADPNVVDYWLWDSAQQPAYQQCADMFAEQNPGTSIRISQFGWDDYWQKLTAGFISDTAPDVFTDHLNKFPQFVDLDVLYPLNELQATKTVTVGDYQPGLADLWMGLDNNRYGLPKDFDTIAYFYDKQQLSAAGVTPEQLATATWNPEDGGSWEKLIAHLTVDKNGVRGDEAGFDKNNVAVYGVASGGAGGDALGQTQWGVFAASMNTSFQLTNKNPWGTQYNLADPEFEKMLTWYFGLADKGFMPTYAVSNSLSSDQQLGTGLAALAPNGSWMINSFKRMQVKDRDGTTRPIDLGIAPSPIGPVGHNGSPFNGLADSVTKQAKNPELAAKWVAFMGSAQCQQAVGDLGIVFPARVDSLQNAIDKHAADGVDVSAFTDHLRNKTTALLPVTVNSADVTALTKPAFDAIYIGQQPVSSLGELNTRVNEVLKQ